MRVTTTEQQRICNPGYVLLGQVVVTVELNVALVPEHLRKRLETHLRTAWARIQPAPGWFRLEWAHRDPGDIVIAVEHRAARVELESGGTWLADPEEKARDLAASLNAEISIFLQAHRN